jgi:hypothetical protein
VQLAKVVADIAQRVRHLDIALAETRSSRRDDEDGVD